jgi:hypothetical protein
MKKNNNLFYLMLFMTLSSCSNSYYSMDDFTSVRKFDTHNHLNSKNTALTELAKEDNFCLLGINVDVPDYSSLQVQFETASFLRQKFPDRVNFLTAFTLAGWDSANWASKTIEKLSSDFTHGAIGVKVWKNIGMTYKDSEGHFIMIDNPKFDPVIDFIIQQDKTVVGHLGEPKNCWLPIEKMTVNNDKEYFKNHPEYHMFLHPEYPSYEDQINARDRFLERHPKLRFVGAHMGSLEWSVDELAKRLDKFPNMAVDMAERICHLQYQSKINRKKVRDFMIRYQDRILYATDFEINDSTDVVKMKKEWHNTWLDDWKYFVTDDKMTVSHVDGEIEGLKLPKEVIDKLYFQNAMRWFKITR